MRWRRHSRNADRAKKTATKKSKRAEREPRKVAGSAPVWKATCVTTTPSAATARSPSSEKM
ncbi:hypothetical protein A605_12950 [Corynebacterium halotolerans YIM 70093 = DSM 44683]|uniref:Uncharacterized protein n=1 Tax=Corynebacterium halotolerans YIM 70093 = DSM 44683 TaxID=1121362 RepID=M1PA92_9CORY|nr:hypothetical protein A605_12950 [Corynebacterium halotolerans YIM 70093 = DSM 44683]